MARKNRTPEENAHREKIRELLQMTIIGSMDDAYAAPKVQLDRRVLSTGPLLYLIPHSQ